MQGEAKYTILLLNTFRIIEYLCVERDIQMPQDEMEASEERRDFFISYADSDQKWAEWIAFQLEQQGYTVFLRAWDVRPGSNVVAEMQKMALSARQILSPGYLQSGLAFEEGTWRYKNKSSFF